MLGRARAVQGDVAIDGTDVGMDSVDIAVIMFLDVVVSWAAMVTGAICLKWRVHQSNLIGDFSCMIYGI